MKLKIMLCLSCIYMFFSTQAQTGRNQIEVFYTPQITRTYFEAILMKNPQIFKEFYETERPTQPLGGHSLGIAFLRKYEHLNLGISIQQNLRGQRSGFAYNYAGLIPSDTLAGYGGLNYHFILKSISLETSLGVTLHQKTLYSWGFRLGIGLDLYQNAYLEQFDIKTERGWVESGCCGLGYLHSENYFTNIYRRFQEGFYRLSLSLTWRNELVITKGLYIGLSPEAFFLTKILTPSKLLDLYVPDGVIWAVGLQTALGYRF